MSWLCANFQPFSLMTHGSNPTDVAKVQFAEAYLIYLA